KTATAWNMYANLVTVDGESNHLVVRATLPLRDGQENLVRVVSSSDPGLQAYADDAYLLPWPSFLVYLADHPGTEVVYERGGELFEVTTADRVNGGPVWWRLMPLRAIHADSPDRCQVGYLPAL
ncbi:MAG TPA: hypothetical protein VJ938_14865, partial [Acidimicrobiia bacterium]|nr:hypothetical protein [Acidimicrobiia bacterium]